MEAVLGPLALAVETKLAAVAAHLDQILVGSRLELEGGEVLLAVARFRPLPVPLVKNGLRLPARAEVGDRAGVPLHRVGRQLTLLLVLQRS